MVCCCCATLYLRFRFKLDTFSISIEGSIKAREMELLSKVKLFLASIIIFQSVSYVFCTKAKILRNQRCMPRETVVHVGKINGEYYYPLVVKLNRCGGNCRNVPAKDRKCVAKSFENVPVRVRILGQPEQITVIYMRNDTSCDCPCAIDETHCNAKTQTLDKNTCRCECSENAESYSWSCKAPFQWDASLCRCKCHLRCNHLQILDEKSCRCKCKATVYEECSSMNKYVKPDSCRCVSLNEIQKSSGGKNSCDAFPTKWLAILVFVGFVMFFILAFDCILCCRQTGLLYNLLPCLHNKRNNQPEETNALKLKEES